MAALSTIALVVGAAAAIGGTTYSVVQGEAAKSEQKKALGRQEKAQAQAVGVAATEQRRADEEQRRANRRTPDIGSLLAFEQGRAGFGGSSRTGAGAPDLSRLNLKRPTTTLGSP